MNKIETILRKLTPCGADDLLDNLCTECVTALQETLQDLRTLLEEELLLATPTGHVPYEMCCDKCELREQQRQALKELFGEDK